MRSKGMTLNVSSFSAINLFWLELAPTAFRNIHWKFYLVFICLSVCNAFVVYLFFPDTLGRPLEEIAQLFGDEVEENNLCKEAKAAEEMGKETVIYDDQAGSSGFLPPRQSVRTV
jgi:hypothetical protein